MSPFESLLRDRLNEVLAGIDIDGRDPLELQFDELSRIDSLAALEVILTVEDVVGVEMDRTHPSLDITVGSLARRLLVERAVQPR